MGKIGTENIHVLYILFSWQLVTPAPPYNIILDSTWAQGRVSHHSVFPPSIDAFFCFVFRAPGSALPQLADSHWVLQKKKLSPPYGCGIKMLALSTPVPKYKKISVHSILRCWNPPLYDRYTTVLITLRYSTVKPATFNQVSFSGGSLIALLNTGVHMQYCIVLTAVERCGILSAADVRVGCLGAAAHV